MHPAAIIGLQPTARSAAAAAARQAVVPREGGVSVAFISAGVVFLSPAVGPGWILLAIVQLPAYLDVR